MTMKSVEKSLGVRLVLVEQDMFRCCYSLNALWCVLVVVFLMKCINCFAVTLLCFHSIHI